LGHGRGARMSFEADVVRVLGGLRHGVSIGSPLAVEVGNSEWPKWQAVMSADPVPADLLAEQARNAPLTRPRPGHADLVGMQKYGFDDARPVLERASARETATRVALGAVAEAFLAQAAGIVLVAHTVAIGPVAVPDDVPLPGPTATEALDADPVRCHHAETSAAMVAEIDACRRAGDTLGGVVEVVVPDNLKAAVIRAAFGIDGGTALNRSYRELARHCNFKVDPTPIYDPGKKGKVESGVKYVKRNFFKPSKEKDAALAGGLLHRWVHEIAGTREHGTTHRRPFHEFREVEQEALKPLPALRFEPTVWKEARVHQDSHIIFDKRLYSVPWKLIGQVVWVRATSGTVAIFHDDVRVATHDRRDLGHRSTQDGHLPEYRADLRHRSRGYWEERADRIGPDTGRLIREVFDSDDALSMLLTAQAIVGYLERHPHERAEGASRRASHFGTFTYQGVKNILVRALDLEPLPAGAALPGSPQESFRFARSAAELLHRMEKSSEPN